MRRWLCLWTIIVIHSPVFAGVWMDVPFVQQPENGCGAAVASMVFQYWSDRGHSSALPIDVETVQSALYSGEQKGIAGSAIEKYFRDAGYAAFAFKGDMEMLESHLKRGRPLIVYLEDRGTGSFQHFVVVAGLNREAGYILVNDPAERKLMKISLSTFEKQWEMANYWTLLAVPAASH